MVWVALLGVLVLAVMGAVVLLKPGAALPGSTSRSTPAASARVVSTIATHGQVRFSWSPDGGRLLVSDAEGSRVYDRSGSASGSYPGSVAWLDATHLVGADGSVADLSAASPSGGGASAASAAVAPVSAAASSRPPSAAARVVANGRGSAAIVTGTATCSADPTIRWYRNGAWDQTADRGDVVGWSPDGKRVLIAHASCSAGTASGAGWRGSVQVIDFASGRVEGNLPEVTGEVAFGAGGDSIAAQAGDAMEVLDEAATQVMTLGGVRLLGWLDDETLFVERDGAIALADLDPPAVGDGSYESWQAEGLDGLHLAAHLDGRVQAILAPDGSTLLDLSTAGLVVRPMAGVSMSTSASANGSWNATEGAAWLQPEWWSPDGKTLVLPSADGASLKLIAIGS